MSYANFSPTYREQSVVNLFAANISVPATANGAAIVETPLIQTALAAEIPLVLGEGVWVVNARTMINPFDGAETYQYMQSVLYEDANIRAASAPVFGASVVSAANVDLYFSVSHILVVPAGETRSLTYRLRSNGNPVRAIPIPPGGTTRIVAHKISA